MYHYQQWVYANIKEIWALYGQVLSNRALSFPKISDNLALDVISTLPAVQALSARDGNSKIGGKQAP